MLCYYSWEICHVHPLWTLRNQSNMIFVQFINSCEINKRKCDINGWDLLTFLKMMLFCFKICVDGEELVSSETPDNQEKQMVQHLSSKRRYSFRVPRAKAVLPKGLWRPSLHTWCRETTQGPCDIWCGLEEKEINLWNSGRDICLQWCYAYFSVQLYFENFPQFYWNIIDM